MNYNEVARQLKAKHPEYANRDNKELVEKYVRPLYQEGDVLSFGAKVMCMCVESVKTRDEVKFDDVQELADQIVRDCKEAKAFHEALAAEEE